MSRTTRVSRYQKGKTRKAKTNLDLLEQEIVNGSGICWAICKSAPHPRQPRQHPTTQFFTGRMPFLPPNQQHQSTEGTSDSVMSVKWCESFVSWYLDSCHLYIPVIVVGSGRAYAVIYTDVVEPTSGILYLRIYCQFNVLDQYYTLFKFHVAGVLCCNCVLFQGTAGNFQ